MQTRASIPMTNAFRLGFSAFSLIVFCTRYANADAEAERLFREARAAVKDKDYATACPKFAESQRLEPAPGTLMNLAECEEHLGKIVHARDDYALAATGFPRDDPRRAFALQHAAELEEKFAHLIVRLADGVPADIVVRRDNIVVERAAMGVEVDADPGETVIIVTASQHLDRKYVLHLEEHARGDITVDAGDLAPIKTKTVVVEKPRSVWQRPTGLVVGGVGVAALGVGVVTGVLAIARANTVKAHCSGGFCDPTGYDAASEGKILSPVSTALVIAGGALVAIGATLVIWSFGRSTQTAFDPMVVTF